MAYVFKGNGTDKQEKIEQTETAIQTIFYLILINIGIDLLRRDFMVCKILSSLFLSLSFASTLRWLVCLCGTNTRFIFVTSLALSLCEYSVKSDGPWETMERAGGVNGGQTVLFYFSLSHYCLCCCCQ